MFRTEAVNRWVPLNSPKWHANRCWLQVRAGTVGTELALRLLKSGYDVRGADVVENNWSDRVDEVTRIVDLRDKDAVAELDADVDMIVHLGANARVHKLVGAPEGARDNFEMTFNVLEFS